MNPRVDVQALPSLFPGVVELPSLKESAAALAERIKSLLPASSQVEEVALFKKRAEPDPVIAVKIVGEWYSLYEWE